MGNAQTTVNIKPEETELHELTLAELEAISAGTGKGNSGHATEVFPPTPSTPPMTPIPYPITA